MRLVAYGVLLGVSSRIAQTLWDNAGLDALAALQPLHDAGVLALLLAPFVLALIGIGRLRGLAVFTACFLAGAALTAPFVCARVAGA